MRVALNAEPLFQRVATGTGVYTLGLCRALARVGHGDDLVLFHAAHPLVPPDVAALPVTRIDLGIARDVLYRSWADARRPAPQVATGPVDVVHATGSAIPPANGAAIVATVHDLAPLRFAERYPREARVVLKRSIQLASREAARIICPSQFTADELSMLLDVPSSRIQVVPHGVDLAPVDVDDARRFVASRGIPERYVLWVGTQEERKNVGAVLDAFARVRRADPDVRLVLHGPQGWLGETVARGIRVRRLQSRVLVSEGGLTRAELASLYTAASVLVFPSLYEGFGLVVLEAMACGTPVVTSTRAALPECAGDAALLVDPVDADAIAAATLEVLGDAELHSALVARGREHAAAFTWDRTASATWAVYEEAVRP